jgi:hypothetical protein
VAALLGAKNGPRCTSTRLCLGGSKRAINKGRGGFKRAKLSQGLTPGLGLAPGLALSASYVDAFASCP